MKQRISPATAISLVALFFSLTGTGFAASRYLVTSKSQIKPSVLRALKGDQGPRGLTGAQGAQGAIGPAGAQGIQGASAAAHFDGDYSVKNGANLCATPVNLPDFQCQPTADVTTYCQPGDHVLQGGFQGTNEIVTTSHLVARAFINGAFTGRGWQVIAHIDPSNDQGSASAEVLCVRDR